MEQEVGANNHHAGNGRETSDSFSNRFGSLLAETEQNRMNEIETLQDVAA